jgi:hypothetical protein
MPGREPKEAMEPEPEPPLGSVQPLFWLLFFPLLLFWLLLEEEPESDDVVEYHAVAVMVLAALCIRISSETYMECTLRKDGRVDDMVMVDAAWDIRGLRPRMLLRMRTQSSMIESASRKALARHFFSLQ